MQPCLLCCVVRLHCCRYQQATSARRPHNRSFEGFLFADKERKNGTTKKESKGEKDKHGHNCKRIQKDMIGPFSLFLYSSISFLSLGLISLPVERVAIREDSSGCDGSVCVVIALIKSGVFLEGEKEKEGPQRRVGGIMPMTQAHLVNENNLFCKKLSTRP